MDYTANKWSDAQAIRYYDMLLDTCEELAEKTYLGKNYENISRDLFGYLAEKHIIFYRIVAQNEIEIVRILHGEMDLPNRILEV